MHLVTSGLSFPVQDGREGDMGCEQVCLQEPMGSRLLLGGDANLGPLSLPEPQMWRPQHIAPASPPETASGPTCPQLGKHSWFPGMVSLRTQISRQVGNLQGLYLGTFAFCDPFCDYHL